jgi:hypothetical protein
MHFLVISTPRAEKPSAARENQTQFWDWINALMADGIASTSTRSSAAAR